MARPITLFTGQWADLNHLKGQAVCDDPAPPRHPAGPDLG